MDAAIPRTEARERVLPSLVSTTALALGVFLAVRVPPLLSFYRELKPRGEYWDTESLSNFLVSGLLFAVFGYAAGALPGVLLARDGIRRWWWVPAVALLLVPDRLGVRLEPNLLSGSISGQWLGNAWLRAGADLALLLAPGAVVAAHTLRRPFAIALVPRAIAVALCCVVIVLFLALLGRHVWWPAVAAVAAFGFLWDARTLRRVLALVGVTSLFTSTVHVVVWLVLPGGDVAPTDLVASLIGEPMLAVAGVAAFSIPIARSLAKGEPAQKGEASLV